MNYPYYNNYFQPQRQELIKVNGLEGAKNYPLSPGSTIALFDAESDIMYIKSMDAEMLSILIKAWHDLKSMEGHDSMVHESK